ncbi:rolling circle replication-associated protein [Phascolarctobacterium faecium]|jgi:hypothetical protein|uniref:rolling circle replication-associated protein n=1 Tax=Phascolarctobacterium faecium TaxID=33025 RepID=UPI00351F9D00
MTCYRPLMAWRNPNAINPETGKSAILFSPPENWRDCEPIKVPCGQCVGCRLERSRQWAMRCVHEASLYDDNCFITLTFDDEHIARDGSLHLEDFQKFMKRLRKKFGEGIRFFHCGEYGTLNQRPHHHSILFNFDFPDKELWSVRDNVKLYRSSSLERLWPYGFSTIGDVSFESAAYVARYCLKKVTGSVAESHYQGRKPEYTTMSRRPGIGREWFLKYKNDIFPNDKCVIRGNLVCRPPRYYDKIYDSIDPVSFEKIRSKRKIEALKQSQILDYTRLNVKEKVKKLKLKQLPRPIEM